MRGESLLNSLPSHQFDPRRYGLGAWTDHVHFACDVMATLRPRVFVELGTDRGESYFAFCQAADEQKTGTRCFAVDTWVGDQHSGFYDETTFEEVSRHNDEHYSSFSTLLRCTFAEAAARFESESISLLHVDGCHTEEAVRRDLEVWLPKLRTGGVLLMHDISVRTREFGVWKVWQDLIATGRAFAFEAGPGLGIWQKPPVRALPYPVEDLLSGHSVRAPDSRGPGLTFGVEPLVCHYRECARRLAGNIARRWDDGSIRDTVLAHQTIVQVFYSADGVHREEDSVLTRIGHRGWTDLHLDLPATAQAAPLRVDFYCALHDIEVSDLRVLSGSTEIFRAGGGEWNIALRGDASLISADAHYRIKITGSDPQLVLPVLQKREKLRVEIRLRVIPDD